MTVTPGDVWQDLGTGIALQLGVSGLFYVNTAANLAGVVPKVGVSIPVVNVEGKVNVPARRRLLTTDEARAEAEAAPPPPQEQPQPQQPVEVRLPRQLRSVVPPDAMAGLAAAGFWESLAAAMPPALSKNLTSLLSRTLLPAQARISSDDATAARARARLMRGGALAGVFVAAQRERGGV